jgi:DNA-directed RNA polymerase alpha subunit
MRRLQVDREAIHAKIMSAIQRIAETIYDDLVFQRLLCDDYEQRPDILEGMCKIVIDELPCILNHVADDLKLSPTEPRRRPIDEMFFSVRSAHLLARAGIETLEGLSCWSAAELEEEAGFTPTSLTEIRGVLAQHGLALRDHPPGGRSMPGE